MSVNAFFKKDFGCLRNLSRPQDNKLGTWLVAHMSLPAGFLGSGLGIRLCHLVNLNTDNNNQTFDQIIKQLIQ